MYKFEPFQIIEENGWKSMREYNTHAWLGCFPGLEEYQHLGEEVELLDDCTICKSDSNNFYGKYDMNGVTCYFQTYNNGTCLQHRCGPTLTIKDCYVEQCVDAVAIVADETILVTDAKLDYVPHMPNSMFIESVIQECRPKSELLFYMRNNNIKSFAELECKLGSLSDKLRKDVEIPMMARKGSVVVSKEGTHITLHFESTGNDIVLDDVTYEVWCGGELVSGYTEVEDDEGFDHIIEHVTRVEHYYEFTAICTDTMSDVIWCDNDVHTTK